MKKEATQRQFGAFSDACYSIAKTNFGGGLVTVAFKALFAPVFTPMHLALLCAAVAFTLILLLLGLLAEDDM